MLLMLERESDRGAGAEQEESLDRKWQGGQRDEHVREERETTGFLNKETDRRVHRTMSKRRMMEISLFLAAKIVNEIDGRRRYLYEHLR